MFFPQSVNILKGWSPHPPLKRSPFSAGEGWFFCLPPGGRWILRSKRRKEPAALTVVDRYILKSYTSDFLNEVKSEKPSVSGNRFLARAPSVSRHAKRYDTSRIALRQPAPSRREPYIIAISSGGPPYVTNYSLFIIHYSLFTFPSAFI